MSEPTQNQFLNLALAAWAAGEEDMAKTMLKKVVDNPSMPEGLGEKRTYLEFAGIFSEWLSLLLEMDVPMDHILNGRGTHSLRFLENKEVTEQFFKKYPALLDEFLDSYCVEYYDSNDENLHITLDYLPEKLHRYGEELLTNVGDVEKQTLHLFEVYRQVKGLSWDNKAFQKKIENYFDSMLFVDVPEDKIQKAREIIHTNIDLERLEKLPEASNTSSTRPLKI